MAFKVSSTRLIKITKVLQRADFALNTLEKNGKNTILFPELKKELQDCIEELKIAYDLENFEEWNKMK